MPEPTWPANWSDLDHSALPWRYEVDVDTMPSSGGLATQYRLWAIYACPVGYEHPEEALILSGEEMEEGCDPTATLRWICDTHNAKRDGEGRRFDVAVDIVLNSGLLAPHMDDFWAFVDGAIDEDEARKRLQ